MRPQARGGGRLLDHKVSPMLLLIVSHLQTELPHSQTLSAKPLGFKWIHAFQFEHMKMLKGLHSGDISTRSGS
jgi:hypothetical protein